MPDVRSHRHTFPIVLQQLCSTIAVQCGERTEYYFGSGIQYSTKCNIILLGTKEYIRIYVYMYDIFLN